MSTALDPRPKDEASSGAGAGNVVSSAVRVVVRVRPLIDIEISSGCQAVVYSDDDDSTVCAGDDRIFRFDSTFASDVSQEEVYRQTAMPLVARSLEGYNCTIFAYGQTGSGKTHTMGNEFNLSTDAGCKGIIPRAVIDIFERAAQMEKNGTKVTVNVSFLEIHNEEVRDLLSAECLPGATPDSLQLRENFNGEVTVAGLTHQEISAPADLGKLLERGALRRATASTAMNHHSSRSHALCTLTLEMTPIGETCDNTGCAELDVINAGGECDAMSVETKKVVTAVVGKLHLVDLAGSERVKRTQAEGARFREGVNINKGLLALGQVISALAEKSAHVPYRDSKLTRLLQDSLGGNSHTLMVACVSPADSNLEETVNTLRYATRAMKIENVARRNELQAPGPVSYAEVVSLRKEVKSLQIQLLRAQLARGGCPGGSDPLGGMENPLMFPANRNAEGGGASAAEVMALRERELEACQQAKRWHERCWELAGLVATLPNAPEWSKKLVQNISHTGSEVTSDKAHSMPDIIDNENTIEDVSEGVLDSKSECAKGTEKLPRSTSVFTNEATIDGDMLFNKELRNRIADLQQKVSVSRNTSESTSGITSRSGSVRTLDSEEMDTSFGSDVSGDMSNNSMEVVGTEELHLVDAEIQEKERELQLKAQQAQLYESVKCQFEGVLHRLQAEKEALQSQRDGLLQRITNHSATGGSSTNNSSSSSGNNRNGANDDKLVAMKQRVSELEKKLKENGTRLLQQQREMREKAAVCREAERLRNELDDAKRRRAALQKQMADDATAHRKEKREHQLSAARSRREGERMQWELKKLQDMQSKMEAGLKRKQEEHALALRKVRALQGPRGNSNLVNTPPTTEQSEAKRTELKTWAGHEIEEAVALSRARSTLKDQLTKRGAIASELSQKRQRNITNGLEDLEQQVRERSAAISSLQAYILASEKGGGGPAGVARWSRLKTMWEMKVVLGHLLTTTVLSRLAVLETEENTNQLKLESQQLKLETSRLSRELRAVQSQAITEKLNSNFPIMQEAPPAHTHIHTHAPDEKHVHAHNTSFEHEQSAILDETSIIMSETGDWSFEDEESYINCDDSIDEDWVPTPKQNGYSSKRVQQNHPPVVPVHIIQPSNNKQSDKLNSEESSDIPQVEVEPLSEPLEKFNIPRLKEELKKRGLHVSGTKGVLIARLRTALAPTDMHTDDMDTGENVIENKSATSAGARMATASGQQSNLPPPVQRTQSNPAPVKQTATNNTDLFNISGSTDLHAKRRSIVSLEDKKVLKSETPIDNTDSVSMNNSIPSVAGGEKRKLGQSSLVPLESKTVLKNDDARPSNNNTDSIRSDNSVPHGEKRKLGQSSVASLESEKTQKKGASTMNTDSVSNDKNVCESSGVPPVAGGEKRKLGPSSRVPDAQQSGIAVGASTLTTADEAAKRRKLMQTTEVPRGLPSYLRPTKSSHISATAAHALKRTSSCPQGIGVSLDKENGAQSSSSSSGSSNTQTQNHPPAGAVQKQAPGGAVNRHHAPSLRDPGNGGSQQRPTSR